MEINKWNAKESEVSAVGAILPIRSQERERAPPHPPPVEGLGEGRGRKRPIGKVSGEQG